jgi:hypothetical protein
MWLGCQVPGPTLMRSQCSMLCRRPVCEHLSGIEYGLPIHRAEQFPLPRLLLVFPLHVSLSELELSN